MATKNPFGTTRLRAKAAPKRQLVQTVFRAKRSTTTPAIATPKIIQTVNALTSTKPLQSKVLKARALRKAAAPPKKLAQRKSIVPVTGSGGLIKPAVYKKDVGKQLKDRLNDVLLAQLRQRKVTNAQAAEALGVHETYLSRIVAKLQDKSAGQTVTQRTSQSKLFKARTGTRAELAKKVNKGDMTLIAACKAANCSERTMFRWCAKYANVGK